MYLATINIHVPDGEEGNKETIKTHPRPLRESV